VLICRRATNEFVIASASEAVHGGGPRRPVYGSAAEITRRTEMELNVPSSNSSVRVLIVVPDISASAFGVLI
jgi:hypothetical protein